MISSTFIFGIASLFAPILNLILLPIYSVHLTTAEFGIISAMGIASSLIATFHNLALDRAALRFYFESDDEINRKKILGTFFISSVSVASVVFICLY